MYSGLAYGIPPPEVQGARDECEGVSLPAESQPLDMKSCWRIGLIYIPKYRLAMKKRLTVKYNKPGNTHGVGRYLAPLQMTCVICWKK